MWNVLTLLFFLLTDYIVSLLQPLMEHIKRSGGTLISDGWTNCQGQPLLNLIVQTSQGPVFLFTKDSSMEIKSAEYIASVLKEALEQVGSENINMVVTDSAANCKAAGSMLEEKFPHLTWAPCAAHVLDLLMEDIGRMDKVKSQIALGKEVTYFILNHQIPHAIFKKNSSLRLVKYGATR